MDPHEDQDDYNSLGDLTDLVICLGEINSTSNVSMRRQVNFSHVGEPFSIAGNVVASHSIVTAQSLPAIQNNIAGSTNNASTANLPGIGIFPPTSSDQNKKRSLQEVDSSSSTELQVDKLAKRVVDDV